MQNEVVIRQNRSALVKTVVLLSMTVVFTIIVLLSVWGRGGIRAILVITILGALLLAMLIYYLKELLERKAEIVISHEGVYLRNVGLCPWSLIKSFSTVGYDEPYKQILVLHFENYADEDFEIINLERNLDDIIDLMHAYKGSSRAYYAGHVQK